MGPVSSMKGAMTSYRCCGSDSDSVAPIRPPSTSHYIFDMLADSIFLLQPTLLKNFLLIGDFNVDIEHGFGPRLTDLMTTFGLTQVVKSPTRISTSGSKTTIDLCFISNPKNLQFCVTSLPSVHLTITPSLLQ